MLYLDANAASQLRPGAQTALAELGLAAGVGHTLGNPSSIHATGRRARAILERGREALRAFLGFQPRERIRIVFTSGGTEGCNLLITGFLTSAPVESGTSRKRIVASAIEHPAVLEPIRMAEARGYLLTFVGPDPTGRCRVDEFLSACVGDTALVALMGANNETGAVQPLLEVAVGLRRQGYRGAIVADLAQALGKSDTSVPELFAAGVDAVALSGCKLGALSGIGAVILNEAAGCASSELTPLLRGGSQEDGYRAGTPNVVGVASLAGAIEGIDPGEAARIRKLRDSLWEKLYSELPGELERITPADLVGEQRSLSNTLAIRVRGVRAEDLVVTLDLRGLCASTGAACSSGTQRVSHVLLAQGMSPDEAREVVRLSLDWDATMETIEKASAVFVSAVERHRVAGSRGGAAVNVV